MTRRPVPSPRDAFALAPAIARALALALALSTALALSACTSNSGGGDPAQPPSDAAGAPGAAFDPGAPPPGSASASDAPSVTSAPTAPDPALDAFAEQVAQALEAGDVATLAPVLSDPFALGYDGSEWQVLSRAVAAEQLQTNHVPPGTALDVTNSDKAVRDALAGRVDVDGLFGGTAGSARMLLVTGWDAQPDRQGVVFLTPGPAPDGGYVWTALLIVR